MIVEIRIEVNNHGSIYDRSAHRLSEAKVVQKQRSKGKFDFETLSSRSVLFLLDRLTVTSAALPITDAFMP